MNKMLKRTVCALTATGVLASMSAFAAWEFAGYDTTDPSQYIKLYNEKINGYYTSKHKAEPVKDKDVKWVFEGYELAYPHAGYERLYLEGNAQKAITRLTNLYPQWETRFRDFMWEVCGNHRIYERQQTKINGKYWKWDFGNEALGVDDSAVFVPTNRFAQVKDSFKATGVANLDLNGNYVFDVNGKVYNEDLNTIYDRFAKPAPFNVKLDADGNPTKEIADGDLLSIASLSQIDETTGKYVVTDEMIADYIGIPYTKYVTGPSYYGENPTKDVAAMYLEHGDKWEWDADTAVVRNDSKIEWSKVSYEMQEPYYQYQYLIVNGIVMDGRNDTPSIRRYTGGKATPKVEWRYCFAEAEYPYEVIEVKYMEGNDGKMIMAVDENFNPIVRIPTGEYANSYFVVTDTNVEIWIKDNKASYKIATFPRNEGPFGDNYAGYTNGAYYID